MSGGVATAQTGASIDDRFKPRVYGNLSVTNAQLIQAGQDGLTVNQAAPIGQTSSIQNNDVFVPLRAQSGSIQNSQTIATPRRVIVSPLPTQISTDQQIGISEAYTLPAGRSEPTIIYKPASAPLPEQASYISHNVPTTSGASSHLSLIHI